MAATHAADRFSRPMDCEEVDRHYGEGNFERVSWTQRQETPLIVRRRDIEFTDVGRGRVQIAITVTNAGPGRSERAPAVIEAAPFGAFVDWKLLTFLRVPPLDPGESTVLRTEADQTVHEPLGPPDRVSPGRILTALGFSDDDTQRSLSATRRSNRMEMRSQMSRAGRAAKRPASDRSQASPMDLLIRAMLFLAERPPRSRALPPSPFDMLTGPDTYWAGNLNVFIGGTDVERHVAKALRIVPQRTNLAMFFVGDGNGPEWYRFDLRGIGPDWEGAIFDPINAEALSLGVRDGMQIEPGSWRLLRARSMLLLALKPPKRCDLGNVEVHVTQRSTQKTAVVEFSFDPRASGPGCYVVE